MSCVAAAALMQHRRCCRCAHRPEPACSASCRLRGTLLHSCSGCIGGCCLQAAARRGLVQLSQSLPLCNPVSPRAHRSNMSRSTASLHPYSHCTVHTRSIHHTCSPSHLCGGSTLARPRPYRLPSSSPPTLLLPLGNPLPPPFHLFAPLRVSCAML